MPSAKIGWQKIEKMPSAKNGWQKIEKMPDDVSQHFGQLCIPGLWE